MTNGGRTEKILHNMWSKISGLESSEYLKADSAARRRRGLSALSIVLMCIGVAVLIWTGLELAYSATAVDFNGAYWRLGWPSLFGAHWSKPGGDLLVHGSALPWSDKRLRCK